MNNFNTVLDDRLDSLDNYLGFGAEPRTSEGRTSGDLPTVSQDLADIKLLFREAEGYLEAINTKQPTPPLGFSQSPDIDQLTNTELDLSADDQDAIFTLEALSLANAAPSDMEQIAELLNRPIIDNTPAHPPLRTNFLAADLLPPEYVNNKPCDQSDIQPTLQPAFDLSQINSDKLISLAHLSSQRIIDRLKAIQNLPNKFNDLSADDVLRIIAASLAVNLVTPVIVKPLASSQIAKEVNLQRLHDANISTILTSVRSGNLAVSPQIQDKFINIINNFNRDSTSQSLISTLKAVSAISHLSPNSPANQLTITAIGNSTNSISNGQLNNPVNNQATYETTISPSNQTVAIEANNPEVFGQLIDQLNDQAATLIFNPKDLVTTIQPKLNNQIISGQKLAKALADHNITRNQVAVEITKPRISRNKTVSNATTTLITPPSTPTTSTTLPTAPTTKTISSIIDKTYPQIAKSNQLTVYEGLKNIGFNEAEIAGIMATFQVESFNNPNQLENTPAGHITSYAQVIQDNLATNTNIGWGLQQSTPPEKIVYEFKQSDFSLAGTNTANSQLLVYDNMLHSPFDINGQPSTYYNVIQKMTNPAQIALFLETYYERPAKVDLRVEQFATDFYNYFVSKIKLPADIILTYSNVNLNNS